MARYDAQINLLVSGQRELDRLADRLRSIERQIVDINRLGVSPQQRDPVTGRFGADPDRQNRIRLAGIQRLGKEEERRARLTSARLRGQNAELERSILLQSRLNSAVSLYETELEKLSRGGGGAKLSESLREQIRDIQAAYDAATAGGTKNLSIVKSLGTELGRIVERQNEINRLSSFQSKSFYDTQRFERRIAELRRAGAAASEFGGVGRQIRQLRSAQARGSEFEAKDISRRIKESLDRITRELDAVTRQAKIENTARVAARSWEKFFEEANINARRLEQNQKDAAEKFRNFFEDAANQAFEIKQNAKDTRRAWQNFFEDAQKEAERIRNERISRFARRRGRPDQYGIEAGPLPAGAPGAPRYFQEAKKTADQLLNVENEIGRIRQESLNESLKLETKRLSLAKEYKRQAADALLEAVTFGKGSQVKRVAKDIATGSQNALVRGGLGLGALGISGAYVGAQEALSNLNFGPLQGQAVKAADAIGNAINSSLGGIPEIVNQMLSALGNIPSSLGLATVAALAFAPAMKTAGEAVFLAGKKFGQTKFGENVKLTLNRQTNLFESAINAASQMTMPIDASGFERNLEVRQSGKETADSWRSFFEEAAYLGLQLKQDSKDTATKWSNFFKDASYQALQISQNSKNTRKSWQTFFEDAAYEALSIRQKSKETAEAWKVFFADAAAQALEIKQNLKKTAESWRTFFFDAASETLRVSQEVKNTANNWRSFFENAAYQALQIKQSGKETSESWRVFFEDAAYEAFSIKEKAKLTRSSWERFFEEAKLEAKRLRGGSQTGLQGSLKRLEEARGARQKFLGSASPAQAIDQIVREFNKGASGGGVGQVAENVTDTYASGIKAGIPAVAQAMTNLGKAGIDAIKKALGMASPSRVMLAIAKNQVDTYVDFLRAALPVVEAVAKSLGEAGAPNVSGVPESAIRKPITEKARTRPLTAEQLDRNSVIAEYAASQITGPMGQFEQVKRKIEDFIDKTRTTVDLDKLFGGQEDERFAMATRGKSAGPEFDKIRAALADFYQVPAELTPDLERGVKSASEASVSADELTKYVSELTSGIEQIGVLLQSAAKLPAPAVVVDNEFTRAQQAAAEADAAAAETARRKAEAQKPFEVSIQRAAELDAEAKRKADAAVSSVVQAQIEADARAGAEAISKAILDPIESAAPEGERQVRSAIGNLFDRVAGALGFGGGGGGGRPPAPPTGGGGATRDPGDFNRRLSTATEQGAEALLGLQELRDPTKATTVELEALSGVLKEFRKILDPTAEGFERLEKQLRESAANLDRQVERRAPDAGFLTRQFGPRTARGLSEGLIGGAFPLLFGQGIGAAVGGGAGGFAGGFAGGGLGFGLSLVGTALGTAFDQLNQAAQETGKALKYPVEAFDQLKEAGLLAGRQQEYYISKLIEAGKMTEAAGEIQAEIIKKIGVRGVEDLRRLGDSSSKLSKAWAEFNLQLQAALAGPMAGLLKWLAGVIEAGNSIGKEAARQGDIASGLSSSDLKRLQAEEQRILSGANLFNEAAKRQEVAQLYSRFESSANINAPAAQLTPEQLDAQKKAQGVTKELQAQVELQRKQLSLTGLTLERDGARYVNAAKAVALQEYENKLLEIKNSWIGQIFDKEQNLAKIRSANLEYAAKLKQVNEEVARRQEEVYRNSRQAELAFYQEAQKRNDLTIRIAEFNEGEEAGLRERLDLSEAIKQQKLSEFKIEAELAMIEARKNGTALQTAALNANRLSTLESELDLENKIAYQKFAQLQLNKFLATEEAKRQAVDPFVQFRQSQQLDQQYAQTYHRLLTEGIAPAEAKRLADFERLVSEQLRSLDIQVAIAQSAYDEAVARGILGQELKDYADNLERVKGARAAAATNAALGAGPAVEEIPGAKIQEFISTAEEELKDLEALAVRVSQSIGDAVGNSLANGISGLVEGTTTAKQVFADFLKEVGQILVREGTSMIATYIAIGIAKLFAGLGGGGGGGGKGLDTSGFKQYPMLEGPGFTPSANGSYFANGIAAFANGGMFTNSIVSSPTLFKFADGGAMRTGVMGEAGPEAIMPLSRGSDGRLGVDANGLREAMSASGGSSSTPMLNMTFETTSINGVEYVSREQLETAMAATRRQAAKDGAKQGMNMTLDRLQQSPKTRSRVGLR